MKTLSVRQPWAWLIVNGYKTVENRSWRTNHRGPLAIHAALTIDEPAIKRTIAQCIADGEPLTARELRELRVTGAVIGTVTLADCTKSPTDPDDLGWHIPGNWAWVLRDPEPIRPVAVKGRLGLFDITL